MGMKQDENETEYIVVPDFQKGDSVVTPDGPGKVDGYSTKQGSNERTGHLWVWLDGVEKAPRLRPYKPEEVQHG